MLSRSILLLSVTCSYYADAAFLTGNEGNFKVFTSLKNHHKQVLNLAKAGVIRRRTMSLGASSSFEQPSEDESSSYRSHQQQNLEFDHSSDLAELGNDNMASDNFDESGATIPNYDPLEDIVSELENFDSPLRHDRLAQETANDRRFFKGQELVDSRARVVTLREKMEYARKVGNEDDVKYFNKMIDGEEYRDADLVYKNAKAAGDDVEAANARPYVPQLNLHGLWVGKYGSSGYQMVNVTYIEDDLLVATKVTGDKNVPAGEISFSSNLKYDVRPLPPIDLSDAASKKWGISRLERYSGRGQVAAEGFQDAQWVDGQFILVGEYFSFAWVPLGTQIFFGRPSLALMMKMLKDGYGMDDTRFHLHRCMDTHMSNMEEMESCILDFDDDESFQ